MLLQFLKSGFHIISTITTIFEKELTVSGAAFVSKTITRIATIAEGLFPYQLNPLMTVSVSAQPSNDSGKGYFCDPSVALFFPCEM